MAPSWRNLQHLGPLAPVSPSCLPTPPDPPVPATPLPIFFSKPVETVFSTPPSPLSPAKYLPRTPPFLLLPLRSQDTPPKPSTVVYDTAPSLVLFRPSLAPSTVWVLSTTLLAQRV